MTFARFKQYFDVQLSVHALHALASESSMVLRVYSAKLSRARFASWHWSQTCFRPGGKSGTFGKLVTTVTVLDAHVVHAMVLYFSSSSFHKSKMKARSSLAPAGSLARTFESESRLATLAEQISQTVIFLCVCEV